MSCLAKAQFDNQSDSPDELSFRVGDVLTVIEFDTGGLEGWWLCSWRGRRGLAPGNRLRVLQGIYDSPAPQLAEAVRQDPLHRFSGNQAPKSGTSPLVESGADLSLAENWPPPTTTSTTPQRRSWDVTPNKVVTPRKVGDIYVYPAAAAISAAATPASMAGRRTSNSGLDDDDDYDVPSAKKNHSKSSSALLRLNDGDVYDTPQLQRQQQQQQQRHLSSVDENISASLSIETGDLVYDAPPLRQLGDSKQSLDDGSMLTLSSSSSNQSLGQLSGVGGPLSPANLGRPAKTMRTESPVANPQQPQQQRLRGASGGKRSPKSASSTTQSDEMDDYDVPKPFSPTTSDAHSNVSSESLYRSNSPPSSSASDPADIYDRPPSQSRSSCGSGLNISSASASGAAGGGSCGGSIVSGIGGGFEGSPCKLSSSTTMTTATAITSGQHHHHHQHHHQHHHHLSIGQSASSFNLGSGSGHSFLGSGSALSLSDFRASSETSLPPLLDAASSANDESIYDSPAASTTTALSPSRSIGCISNRSSSSEMLLLGASSSDLKGSLNTIPEGKELRTTTSTTSLVRTDEDSQPDYDVPVAVTGRRIAAAAAAAVSAAETAATGERPALPQRNLPPPLHPGVRAEKAQTLPASYSLDDDDDDDGVLTTTTTTTTTTNDKKYSSLARKSSHDSPRHDLPPSYQPQQRANESSQTSSSSSSSSSSDRVVAMEIPADVDSAVETLERLREDVKVAADKLLAFVGFSWRSKDELEPKIFEIEQACVVVKSALKTFVDFSLGVVERVGSRSSSTSSVKSAMALTTKLKGKLAPLQIALECVSRSMEGINATNWQVANLIQPSPNASSSSSSSSSSSRTTTTSTTPKDSDALDRIVAVSRVVLEEVSSVAVVIQGNASLIFDKTDAENRPRPLPSTPASLTSPTSTSSSSATTPSGASKPPLKPKPVVLPDQHSPRGGASSTSPSSVASPTAATDGVANRPLPQLPPGATTTTPQNRPLPDVPRDRQTERLTAPAGSSSRIGANSPSPRSSPRGSPRGSPRASPLPRPTLGRELDVDSSTTTSTTTTSVSPPPLPPPPPTSSNDDDSSSNRQPSSTDNNDPVDPRVRNLNLRNSRQSLPFASPPPRSAIDELDAFIKEHSIVNNGIVIEDENGVVIGGNNGSATNGLTNLSPNDRQILGFYSSQVTSLGATLGDAIETFFQSVDKNDGPKHFIAHSKIVVLSGHKLVYVGDTLHRNIYDAATKSRIAHCANGLCDALKHVVTSTKRAALQYPAVATLQQMVDTVVQVSHAAHQLKTVIMTAGEAS